MPHRRKRVHADRDQPEEHSCRAYDDCRTVEAGLEPVAAGIVPNHAENVIRNREASPGDDERPADCRGSVDDSGEGFKLC